MTRRMLRAGGNGWAFGGRLSVWVWAGLATLLAATVLLLALPAVADSTGTCSEAGATTVTVTCTAGMGTWTPPPGVTSATFDVEGGHGGSNGSAGGAGGKEIGRASCRERV